MATSQTHLRSISLPSRLPDSSSSFDCQIEKLKSFKHVNSKGIQSSLVDLANLYNSVQELTQLSSVLDFQNHLDGSIELIDSCNIIREMIHTIQENVQSLQSAIRRKGIDSSSIQDDISSYLSFRKKMNKNLPKSLKTLKKLEKQNVSVDLSSNAGHDHLLREATEITTAVLRRIFMYLSCPIGKSGSWNLISKLMITKPEASVKDHCVKSEVERLDCALAAKVLDGLTVQSSLQDLDSCMEGLESGLDTLYRQLIRCRVTILNIITDH